MADFVYASMSSYGSWGDPWSPPATVSQGPTQTPVPAGKIIPLSSFSPDSPQTKVMYVLREDGYVLQYDGPPSPYRDLVVFGGVGGYQVAVVDPDDFIIENGVARPPASTQYLDAGLLGRYSVVLAYDGGLLWSVYRRYGDSSITNPLTAWRLGSSSPEITIDVTLPGTYYSPAAIYPIFFVSESGEIFLLWVGQAVSGDGYSYVFVPLGVYQIGSATPTWVDPASTMFDGVSMSQLIEWMTSAMNQYDYGIQFVGGYHQFGLVATSQSYFQE